jgi:molybdopterin-guanine dinucleotide biosynthesis protein A
VAAPGVADGPPRFTGAILCGGRSRRMGRDKALVPVAGAPMIVRVAEALWVAGAHDVVAVGREPGELAQFGLTTVPDRRSGRGPAGGIATALAWGSSRRGGRGGMDEIVLVVGCDLLAPSPAAMGATVAALAHHATAAVSVPVSGGRTQWHHAAWRRSAAPAVESAVDAGARGVGQVVVAAGLVVAGVDGIDAAALADADTPEDLPAPRMAADRAADDEGA